MTDLALAGRLAKLQSILEVAKAMTAERQLDRLLALVVDAAAKVAEADRCTLFVVDREKGELWSKVAHGGETIRIPLGAGIAGARSTRPGTWSSPRTGRPCYRRRPPRGSPRSRGPRSSRRTASGARS